jgi:HlyD family secretion protein
MNPRLRPVIAVVVLGLVGLAAWKFWPHGGKEGLTGYVEADLMYLSAPVSGAVSSLTVEKGARVAAGQALFQIDPKPQAAEQAQAEAALAAAQAQALDAEKGQRPPELAVIQAQRAAAQARLNESRKAFERVRVLAAKGWYAPARLDQARAEYQTTEAEVREVERRLDVAELGQRPDEIVAARARAVQAAGGVDAASARLDQLSPRAPTAARVQDVFFQPGEWAPANQPVVALLPDARVKLRFFVPQDEVARYQPGRMVGFGCDGCAKGLRAKISFVSAQPEFTPPVIYSRSSRDKLVFLVEALPEHPRDLTPGLPVDVVPLAGEGR